MSNSQAEIDILLSATAVRERAQQILAKGEAGELRHWQVNLDRLPAVTDYVCKLTRENYPDLNVPFHSRWRHLEIDGKPLWPDLEQETGADWGRTAIELIILSVLLDAGAGPDWQYQASTGQSYGRSEGLAIASYDLYLAGGFNENRNGQIRQATAKGLQEFQESHLVEGFQVTTENPLVGTAGRTQLIQALGKVVATDPIFTRDGQARLGHFFDALKDLATAEGVAAEAALKLVLTHLGPIWPSRLSLAGQPLGDVWPHPDVTGPGATNGLMPFHKLSQWLTYSLLDGLTLNKVPIHGVTALTGLPEYRNGGLLIDFEVLVPKEANLLSQALQAADEPIVEWRALTVALLDRLGTAAQQEFGKTPDELPLACILQGGTWSAGRKIAASKRPGGLPPLNIVSDGTVF